jgi:hypothetical protein
MHAFWKLRHAEHEAGWYVLLEGKRIAELDYLHDDQPFHLFRARLMTHDLVLIDYALRNTKRDPEDKLQFHCRTGSVVVTDRDFFVNLHADGRVSIRDMRLGPKPSITHQIWQRFISELFTPGRLGFYSCAGAGGIVAIGIVVIANLHPPSFFSFWPACIVVLLASRALFYAFVKTKHQNVAGKI